MKITLLTVGNTEKGYIQEGINLYSQRLKHYASFEIAEIPTGKNSGDVINRQKIEADLILKKLSVNDKVVLLDELGKAFTSKEFAVFLNKQMVQGLSSLVFIIGGAHGFDPKVYARADYKIALSKMTFPHQLIRIIFVEQLYRAFTILKNEKYHH